MEPSTAPWLSNMDRSVIDEWGLLGSLDQLMINQNIWNDIDPLSSESYHPSFITSNTITTTTTPPPPPPPPPNKIESWESSCTVDLKPIRPAPHHAINLSFGSPDHSPSDQSDLYEITSTVGSGKPFNRRSSTKRSYEEALMVAQGAKCTNAAKKPPYYNQDHVLAERKRREKLTQKFIALSAIVPGLKKMDKASVLEDAVKYLKQLEKKVKDLEDQQAAKRRVEYSAILVNKPPQLVLATDDANYSSCDENFEDRSSDELPEIKVRLSDKSVLVRMHCENRKGLLAKALSEIENLHLTVINTSVVPFASSLIDVTVTAQIEDGFSMTVKDLVKNLNLAVREFI